MEGDLLLGMPAMGREFGSCYAIWGVRGHVPFCLTLPGYLLSVYARKFGGI